VTSRDFFTAREDFFTARSASHVDAPHVHVNREPRHGNRCVVTLYSTVIDPMLAASYAWCQRS